MMPILVKSGDVRSGRKAKVCHGRLWVVTGGTGVNGLIITMMGIIKWNPSSPQFVVYGCYFFLIGAVFLARAVFHMTRVGWQRSWQQRYYIGNEDQFLALLGQNMNGEDLTEPDGEPIGENNDHILTDEVMDNQN